METLKIALASDWFYPKIGGIEAHIDELARQLMEAGHEPHVITHDYRFMTPYVDDYPYPVYRLRGLVYFKENHVSLGPGLLVEANRIYKRVGFDVTHVHSIYSPLSIAMANLSRGIRGVGVVATNHSLFGEPRLGWLIKHLIRRYTRRVDCFIAVSSKVAEDTLRVLGDLGDRRLSVIHNGIDSAYWRPPTDSEREECRKRLGARDGEVVVASVGRMTARKRMDIVPRIVGRVVRETGVRVRLVIAGDGPMRSMIEEEVERSGLGGTTVITGFLPRGELRRVYWAADVFVMPGILEAFSIATLEAMATGLPVVAHNRSGVSDLVLDGVNGFLADTEEELSERLKELVMDEDLRRRMGDTGRRRVEEEFAWHVILPKIVEEYREAMERASRIDKRYLLYRLWRRIKG